VQPKDYLEIQSRLQEIDVRVAQLQTERANLDKQLREEDLRIKRVSVGVRVVCPECLGAQMVSMEGGSTNEPYEEPCGRCGGRGWLWAVEWRDDPRPGTFTHEAAMEINEVR